MFAELLERIALVLEEAQWPYMVIGGQAVMLYGEPRLTKDIGITLGVDVERLPELLPLVGKMQLQPLVEPDTFTRQTWVLPCRDEKTGIRVDFIFSFSLYEQQALQRIHRVRLRKAEVRFASLEDTIIHKVIAGRARDVEDVRGMLLKNPQVDLEYIRRWLQEFSEALAEPFLAQFEQIWKSSL